ncbi:hypothetical protein QFZ91_005002 [Paraburkholderia sp. JPY419]
MKMPVIGMDIAKHVFQLHAVDVATGKVERVKIKRGEVADSLQRGRAHVSRLKPAVVLITGPANCRSLAGC